MKSVGMKNANEKCNEVIQDEINGKQCEKGMP